MDKVKTKIRVVVVSGGPGDEHEVSVKSGEQVLENLDKEKFSVTPVFIDKDQNWHFDDRVYALDEALLVIKKISDVVFIALHGEFGEDGFLQAVFDGEGIKYTGSGAESSALSYNKLESSKIFAKANLLQPQVYLASSAIFPCVVKPVFGGSSVGVVIAQSLEELEKSLEEKKKLGVPVLIQEFIAGREFTCGVLEKEKGEALPLVPTEIIPNSASFFDYEAKYTKGASTEVTPPNLEPKLIAELQNLVLTAHKALSCRGMSRSDFILKEGKFYILETNTIPGLTETSLLPQGAAAAGIGFAELLEKIIKASL